MSPSNTRHFVPSDGLRCIWMTAGILSYQLCDRSYDCDNCPLDAAMKKHFSRQVDSGPGQEERPKHVPEGLRDGLRYGRNHCWIGERSEPGIRVGIEPGLSMALFSPKAVVFPSQGQHIQKGQTCLWIVLEGGTLPFEAPFSGTVRNNNRALGDRPHLLNTSPYDEGWLFELEPDENALQEAGLVERDKAETIYREDDARFLRLLGNALQGNRSDVGITLADGGQRLQNISDTLGAGKYFSIIRKSYAP